MMILQRIAGPVLALAFFLPAGLAAAAGDAAPLAAMASARAGASLDARPVQARWVRYAAAARRHAQPGAYWSPKAHAAWRREGFQRLQTQMRRSRPTAIRILGARTATANVRFTVLSDGRMTKIGLVRGSGVGAIDRLALTTLRNVGRMPAPGPHRRVNITVPLQFVGSGVGRG